MKRQVLNVAKREVLGKKVKKLRKEGILPGNIYGKDIASLAVQMPTKEFKELFKQVGYTGLIDIQLEGEKVRPALIHDVHFDHVAQAPLHVDFYQVNLKEKVRTMVPVVLVGEPQAVTDKVGELLQTMNEVEVEALPGDLPEKFEVDVTKLATLEDQITIADLQKPQGVELTAEPEQVVAKIAEQQKEPEPTPEEAAPAEEGAEGEQAATEEDTPAEEEK